MAQPLSEDSATETQTKYRNYEVTLATKLKVQLKSKELKARCAGGWEKRYDEHGNVSSKFKSGKTGHLADILPVWDKQVMGGKAYEMEPLSFAK